MNLNSWMIRRSKVSEKQLTDFFDVHKNKPAIICGHGPSLDYAKRKLEFLKEEDDKDKREAKRNDFIRFNCNRWYDFFGDDPDYWVLCNNDLTIHSEHTRLNQVFKRENPRLKGLFFASSVDLSGIQAAKSELDQEHSIWCSYDERHFENKTCNEILSSVEPDSTLYGNNPVQFGNKRFVFGNSGFDPQGRCCAGKLSPTIQEVVQNISSHESHYSTGDTVALHMISLAIIMGCNPIQVVGVDLDYNIGYAEGSSVPAPRSDSWEWKIYGPCIQNDFRILKESAELRGIQIEFVNY